MSFSPSAIVLVGHGVPPSDAPRSLVMRLKALEGQRRAARQPPSDEERSLDQQLRSWPRTPANDPYRVGLESLADALRARRPGLLVATAYNEFCAPSLDEAVDALIAQGHRALLVLPSMITPGGVHAEVEIPELLDELRQRHPDVQIVYAWPFDPGALADALLAHTARFVP